MKYHKPHHYEFLRSKWRKVLEDSGISPFWNFKKCRDAETVKEKKKAILLLYNTYRLNMVIIGRILGYEDHTTVAKHLKNLGI